MIASWSSASFAACTAFLCGVGVATIAVIGTGLGTFVRFHAIVVGILLVVGMIAYIRRWPLGSVAMVAGSLGIVRLVWSVPSETIPVRDGSWAVIAGVVTESRGTPSGDVVVRLSTPSITSDAHPDALSTTPRAPVDLILRRTSTTPRYGDWITGARCQWRTPTRLRDQLTIAGRCIVRDTADVHVVPSVGGSALLRKLGEWRVASRSRLERWLTEPTASLVSGLLLGIDRGLPGGLTDAFRRTGTAHILVVSGWHMSILGIVARNWLLRMGIPRMTGILLAGCTVAAFTGMVGFSPSAVRGSLTVGALLLIDAVGRLANPIRVLVIVATAMVAIHPAILGFDVGFQLSIAATAGILLGHPFLDRVLTRVRVLRSAWGEPVRSLVAVSTAAALATTPITAGTFGTIALLAPIVNVPVLVLTVPLTLVGLSVLLADVLVPPLAPVLAWVATAVADAITAVVSFAASIPWAAFPAHRFDAWFTGGVLVLLLATVVLVARWHGTRLLSPFVVRARTEPS